MNQKVLLVDDEPNVLQGYKRHLRKKYDLELAIGGEAALEQIKSSGPFAVVVSDMQMPNISGVELLSQVRELNARTVRIMLTGNADQKTAVDAVNEGNIFRFLSKPCPPEQLAKTIDAGLEQFRLVTAEAELLNETLSGSVRMLTQVLSLAMPRAFGLTQEARTLVRSIAERVGVGPIWQIEMAAMLMRVGCVSLPEEVLNKYLAGEKLHTDEQKLVEETPEIGHSLVSAIPRLQDVGALIQAQNDPPQGDTPIVARILRVVGDYQRFHATESAFAAIKRLDNKNVYDQDIVQTLAEVLDAVCESREVEISGLAEGMVLESHIEDLSGRILVANGAEIHEAMIQKLSMLKRSGAGVREPIQVRVMTQTKSNVESVEA